MMRFVRRLLGASLLALSLFGSSAVLHAQPSSNAQAAEALKKEGDALMGDIRYEEALAKYREAYKLGANPALLYNQGRALEALGRYPEALEMLRSFDAKAPPDLHAKVPNLQKLIDDVEAHTCLLTVDAPAGAQVRMGDVVLGKAPLPEIRVNAGKRVRLEATLEGAEPDVQELDLPGKAKARVSFNLVSKDKTGVLAIDSPVKGATVTVDRLPPRQVPTEIRVPAGRHTVTLTAAGYRTNVVDVEVAVGQRRPVIIEPGESAVYERWWFWTVIGVVVAGGVAGGVVGAYFTEGAPAEGTIPPCQVVVQASGDGCSGGTAFAPVRGLHRTPGEARSGFTFGPVPVLTVRF